MTNHQPILSGDADDSRQPLQDVHMAARYGSAETVQRLVVEIGQSATSRRGSIGSTPAHDAAATGNMSTLTWLLTETGDMPDRAGATVAHVLARYGHATGLNWLVGTASGAATLTVRTRRGATPLHYASAGGHLETVKLIVFHLKRLAEVTANAATLNVAFGTQCQCARCNLDKFVNCQVDSGATAVYLACQEGHLDVARYLVAEATASLKLRTFDGMTCVHAAAQMGHLHVLRWLMTTELKTGVNDRDFEGLSPLHYAAARGHANVVTWLIDNGARFVVDKMGGTALHMAAANGKVEVVRRLLIKGIERDVVDGDDMTAAMLATVCQQEHCAQLINEWSVLKHKEREREQPKILVVPEIVHSSENDVTMTTPAAATRDAGVWPPPPPPLSPPSSGNEDADSDVNNDVIIEKRGSESKLLTSIQLTVSSTETVGFRTTPAFGAGDGVAEARRDDVMKTSPVAPPPTPPPLRLDFGRQTVARTVSVSAALGAQVEPGLRRSPMQSSARGEFQLRSSKSSGDLIAELKAHIGSGGPLSLRRVEARPRGSKVIYTGVGRGQR